MSTRTSYGTGIASFLIAWAIPLSAQALSVSNVSATNTSPPNALIANGNYRVQEFRSGTVLMSPVTVHGADQTFSHQFGFLMSHRVNQPEAPNFALIYLRTLGYAVSFTVEDPLNEGYVVDIDHHLRGYVTVSREEPVTVGASGGGTMLGSFDDGTGPVGHIGLNVFGGGLTIRGTDVDAFGTVLVDKTFTGYTSPVYVGTRTFTVAFSSHPSPALTSIVGNFGGGETEARFGLLPTHASNGNPSRPDFLYADAPGEMSPSELGHFLGIRVTSQNPPDACTPAEERCDGVDNDCDDAVDEGFDVGETCAVGVGECVNHGAKICTVDGGGTICDATPLPPVSERCDAKDNDCDGSIDEDFAELGTSCAAGIGECRRDGTVICMLDGSASQCSAVPGDPVAEICDERDNDCNAVTDDVDSDEDGVRECHGEDRCLATVLPEQVPTSGRLNPNHYAQLDSDPAFEVGCNGKNCTPADGGISLIDTFGCSCEQILSSLSGNNAGLMRYGCSPGIMREWMDR